MSKKADKARAEAEAKLAKQDKGKAYKVRFSKHPHDVKSFYKNRVVLPQAAWWNADTFLFAYIAAVTKELANGNTDWDHNRPGRQAELLEISKLARRYVKKSEDPFSGDDLTALGAEILNKLAEFGTAQLWD